MRRLLPLVAPLLLLSACGKKAPAPKAAAASELQAGPVKGIVQERVEGGNFTYLRLKTDSGEAWAGVPANAVPVGAEVTVVEGFLMERFESRNLHRTFERIYLGRLEGQSGAGAHGGAAATATPESAGEKVEKAAGPEARTVAELFEQRQALAGKTVVVRGKVVKALPGILNRNWLHLRDGSGDPKTFTHDLTVTTASTAALGDVVTVRGTLRLNQDFGSGYKYDVLLENASVQK